MFRLGSLQQAPDGGLWLATADVWSEAEHGGIARFDGSTWQQFLPGSVVSDVDIAADGSVWLRALAIDRDGADGPDVRSDLYVITPEAVVASE